jgi:hypothetical protein
MDALLSLVFHHISKVILGAFLFLLWWAWFTGKLKKYLKLKEAVENADSLQSKEHSGSDNPLEVSFPIVSLVVLVLLTFGYLYYVSMEHSFRDTSTPQSQMIIDRDNEIRRRDAAKIEDPDYTPPETLEEKTARMLQEAQESNAATKEAFKQLPKSE